jgi:hypothetical protein
MRPTTALVSAVASLIMLLGQPEGIVAPPPLTPSGSLNLASVNTAQNVAAQNAAGFARQLSSRLSGGGPNFGGSQSGKASVHPAADTAVTQASDARPGVLARTGAWMNSNKAPVVLTAVGLAAAVGGVAVAEGIRAGATREDGIDADRKRLQELEEKAAKEKEAQEKADAAILEAVRAGKLLTTSTGTGSSIFATQ